MANFTVPTFTIDDTPTDIVFQTLTNEPSHTHVRIFFLLITEGDQVVLLDDASPSPERRLTIADVPKRNIDIINDAHSLSSLRGLIEEQAKLWLGEGPIHDPAVLHSFDCNPGLAKLPPRDDSEKWNALRGHSQPIRQPSTAKEALGIVVVCWAQSMDPGEDEVETQLFPLKDLLERRLDVSVLGVVNRDIVVSGLRGWVESVVERRAEAKKKADDEVEAGKKLLGSKTAKGLKDKWDGSRGSI